MGRRRGILIAGALFLGACSSNPVGTPETLHSSPTTQVPTDDMLQCRQLQAESWTPTPSVLDTTTIAQRLSKLTGLVITPDAIANGTYGPAECAEGITPEELGSGKAASIASNQPSGEASPGQPCLAVGLMEEPAAGQPQQTLLLICPNQSGTQHSSEEI